MSIKRIRRKLKFKESFQRVIDDLERNNLKFFIAGGSTLSALLKQEVDQDLDIFFRSRKDYDNAKKYFKSLCTLVYESDNAITFTDYKCKNQSYFDILDRILNIDSKNTIQIVKKSFGTPEEIISNFDLNKSMIAYENGEIIVDSRFSEPLHVIYKNTKSLTRLMKYSERIYNYQKYQKNNSMFNVTNMYTVNWQKTIKEFNTQKLIPDFYTNSKIPAIYSLKYFLKRLFTNITDREDISDIEIKEVLDKMKIEEAYDLVKDAFIPINYTPKYYFEKVAYFKFISNNKTLHLQQFSKYEGANKETMIDCIKAIKERNPEILFE